jgi:hypothetical protein
VRRTVPPGTSEAPYPQLDVDSCANKQRQQRRTRTEAGEPGGGTHLQLDRTRKRVYPLLPKPLMSPSPGTTTKSTNCAVSSRPRTVLIVERDCTLAVGAAVDQPHVHRDRRSPAPLGVVHPQAPVTLRQLRNEEDRTTAAAIRHTNPKDRSTSSSNASAPARHANGSVGSPSSSARGCAAAHQEDHHRRSLRRNRVRPRSRSDGAAAGSDHHPLPCAAHAPSSERSTFEVAPHSVWYVHHSSRLA